MSSNTTSIRRATEKDQGEIQAIARRTIDSCHRPFLGDQGVEWILDSGEFDRELELHLEHSHVLVERDVIVGLGIWFDDFIHLMMIDVDRHRDGLGKTLLKLAEKDLFAAGYNVIRMETFAGNQQAIDFYQKNGWHISHSEEDPDNRFSRVFFDKSASSK
jgi:ribosomal protein S18 acetylase RimI-like enzyme